MPLFPLHTWLPDAHVEAPTAGSVILAGVLLKMGTYGFIRFDLTLFPEAAVDLVPLMAVLAVIGIIYGGAGGHGAEGHQAPGGLLLGQPPGLRGAGHLRPHHPGPAGRAVIQMVNHGLTTGALFLLVGMIYERRHTRQIADFGGLATVMPVFAGVFLFVIAGLHRPARR